MKKPDLQQSTPNATPGPPKHAERSWAKSASWAAVVVGIGVLLSAVINPALDRVVHWEWVAVLAPTSFALFVWGFRHRWF